MSDVPEPDAPIDALLSEARSALERAYAPYSKLFVGAALATDAGVFLGCNVENVSYGLSICAERVAAVTAVAAGARRFDAIAVASSAPEPIPPCGACRQFLFEFNPAMIVASQGQKGERRSWRLEELLVDGFGPSHLEGR